MAPSISPAKLANGRLMPKRKCKPMEEWTQPHLWPESEAEIRRRTFVAAMKQLPRWKDWHPKEFRAGVCTNP